MARCKKAHIFSKFEPVTMDFGHGGKYRLMTESEIKEKQEESLKKSPNTSYWFTDIKWARKCNVCGKKDEKWLDPFLIPDNDTNVSIRQTGSRKTIREKRYARKLSAYKEEKISKGAQP